MQKHAEAQQKRIMCSRNGEDWNVAGGLVVSGCEEVDMKVADV